jgi:hypothetical protein
LASKGIPTPSITQFELWASKFENHIRIYLNNEFRECGLDPNRSMDFETFKKWIYRDNNLRITYTIKNVIIPVSLVALDEIGFEDNSTGNLMINQSNPNQNLLRYPTLNSGK